MASVTPRPTQHGPGENVRVQRVARSDRREALGVLLTGRAQPNHALVQQFLSYSRDYNLPLNELYAAYRGERPVAAALILPNAGRSGMVFASPASTSDDAALAGRVVDEAARQQDASQMRLLQALLEPEQPLMRQVLEAGGFEPLAMLQYMGRDADLPAVPFEPGDSEMALVTWSRQNRELFARAIEASYEGTADCPALVGLREIDDIIAGHMAAGRFVPDLWFALHRQGEPIGVMLLNELTQGAGFELVYLGIAAPWRGRGLARSLLAYGLGQGSERARATWAADNPRLQLAVDEANTAARELYAHFGFRASTRKLAMIRSLAGG